jgi:signal transduction histidine kinase
MFVKPLALKLLAPTVLVSLALMGACIFGALYLNELSRNLSTELADNVESTRAAQQLENVTIELLPLLRSAKADKSRVEELNQDAQQALKDAYALANWDEEKDLVGKITTGLNEYLRKWQRRRARGADQAQDEELARNLEQGVLRYCRELRNFNLAQIESSNIRNQGIVRQLNWGLLLVGLGAPLSGLLLGYGVARSLHHSIYQLSVGIRDAAGRLNRELGSVTVLEEGSLPDLHKQMQSIIAEIERVVEQLQQREREVLRAEQLAAVGQVAAGVAHELRNPLTSIKMLVQAGLEGSRPAGLPADDLGTIETEIRRMEQTLQMFLDFARPPRSERRQADVVGVLRRALALVDGRARRQKVTLLADLPAEPVPLLIDPEQIHQVALNLLLNSLDALPRGGTVQLSLNGAPRSVTLNQEERARNWSVKIQVHDSGPGIAPRIRERLFEPFVSSKETGVGLGLSISKRLIEAHGGTIRGENAPDGGALFTFTLPA